MRGWTYDGVAFVPVSLDEMDSNAFERRGAFWSEGSVSFQISPDRKEVSFSFQIGPLYGRGYRLRPVGQGKRGRLQQADGPMWMS